MAAPAYRPEIDGLRALAIVPVVLYHAFPEAVPGGFVGVDVFFVISGYLISRIILGGLADGSFSFADFYARRIRRIFPALMLVMLCVSALGWLALGPEDSRPLGRHAMAGATFTSNFLLWHEAGYFDGAAGLKPFLHLWSLAIEEQFYLLWPLLLYLASRWRIDALLVAALVGGVSFLASVHGVFDDPAGAFYSPASRFWELMLGCALAAAERNAVPSELDPIRANLMAGAGLALIAAALVLISRDSAFPGAWALLPTLGTALLIRGGGGAWLNGAVFARRPLVALGLMSYALYLWHWPLLAFLNVRHPEGAPASLRVAALLLALLLAWLTYAFVERRIRARPAKAAVPLLAGAAVVAFLGGLALARMELSGDERLEARLQAAQAWPAEYSAQRRCKQQHPAAGYCALADPDAAPTHALFGDSHANHFFPGLAAAIGRGGGNLIHLGGAGCVPFAGVQTSYPGNCEAVIGAALDYAIAEPGIRTVILAANWHLYARGYRFSAYRNRHAGKLVLSSEKHAMPGGNEALFAAGLARTLDLLLGAGKRVVFLKQAPELETRFEDCLASLRAARSEAWDDAACAVPRRKVDAYVSEYAGLLGALKGRERLTVLDPMTVLCDRNSCRAVLGSELMYRDDLHLSVEGSKRVIGRLWQ